MQTYIQEQLNLLFYLYYYYLILLITLISISHLPLTSRVLPVVELLGSLQMWDIIFFLLSPSISNNNKCSISDIGLQS